MRVHNYNLPTSNGTKTHELYSNTFMAKWRSKTLLLKRVMNKKHQTLPIPNGVESLRYTQLRTVTVVQEVDPKHNPNPNSRQISSHRCNICWTDLNQFILRQEAVLKMRDVQQENLLSIEQRFWILRQGYIR